MFDSPVAADGKLSTTALEEVLTPLALVDDIVDDILLDTIELLADQMQGSTLIAGGGCTTTSLVCVSETDIEDVNLDNAVVIPTTAGRVRTSHVWITYQAQHPTSH